MLSLVKMLWPLIIFQILSNVEGNTLNLALNLLGFIQRISLAMRDESTLS